MLNDAASGFKTEAPQLPAFGADYPETGSTNESGLHWDMVVDLWTGGNIEIDGVKINVDGKFIKEGFPNP